MRDTADGREGKGYAAVCLLKTREVEGAKERGGGGTEGSVRRRHRIRSIRAERNLLLIRGSRIGVRNGGHGEEDLFLLISIPPWM